MGAMKNLNLSASADLAQEMPLPLTEIKPEMRRTFTIDTLDGGCVSVSEMTGFNQISLAVQKNKRIKEILLDYASFAELSHLLYVLKCHKNPSPF